MWIEAANLVMMGPGSGLQNGWNLKSAGATAAFSDCSEGAKPGISRLRGATLLMLLYYSAEASLSVLAVSTVLLPHYQ